MAFKAGSVLGFAAELFQRGILTKADLDGLELKWGDVDAFAALAKKIATREGIGDMLAEGTYRAALKLGKLKGKNLLPYAVTRQGHQHRRTRHPKRKRLLAGNRLRLQRTGRRPLIHD